MPVLRIPMRPRRKSFATWQERDSNRMRFTISKHHALSVGCAIALLDAGFPRNREEVTSRFEIAGQTTTNGVHELTLKPKSESARQFMPQIRIAFDAATFALHSTELWFADGSTMRNTFANAELNP